MTPSGKLTTLYNFQQADGFSSSPLIQATNGDFYGTMNSGGANGYGTVYHITRAGTLTTVHSFNGTDGANPSGLIEGEDGDFYGLTNGGGAIGAGTAFKITAEGVFTVLHDFEDTDGDGPLGVLAQGTDGAFYGTTLYDGTQGGGTAFRMSPTGKVNTLYNFCTQNDCSDGSNPNVGLIQDTNGIFYGTTPFGGGNGAMSDGTIFRLSVGLGPFVETQTKSGKVGATVRILGTDLTGSNSVTFNGTPATFTVLSRTEIVTEVPAGAATGMVEVITPAGALTSNAKFTVIP
jgi:uncharacterized repeat protein (TIGR03803 family)